MSQSRTTDAVGLLLLVVLYVDLLPYECFGGVRLYRTCPKERVFLPKRRQRRSRVLLHVGRRCKENRRCSPVTLKLKKYDQRCGRRC